MSQVGSGRSGAAVGAAGPPSSSRLAAVRRAWPAYVVLACTLLLTFAVWRYAERTVRASEQERFDRVVGMSRAAIDRRLESYLQILMGVRALFASSTAVERAEFRSFVAGLSLETRYPSIRGMSWVPRVPAASRAAHEALMRRGGAPAGYEIHPVEGQAEFHPVAFLEPAEAYEARWFGLDAATRPENREAMERARDTGGAAMSQRLALFRQGEGSGFVIFLPLYRGARPPATVEERRQSFEGFVAATFRPDRLMDDLFGASRGEPVDLELFDAPAASPGRLIYDRTPGAPGPRELSRTVPVVFGGQTWTLRLATLPAFHSLTERLVPYWVLGSGLLISVLAFVITLLQTRALTAARRLGADLQAAERRLRRANERFELASSAVGSAIYDLSLPHGTMTWTQGLTEMCGYRLDEIDATYDWWIERVHPDERARVEARFQAAMADGHDFEADYRFRARDGLYLDVLSRGRFVRDAGGRPVRVVGSMADVSERKRGESVLRDSETRHRTVLESAMDAFVGMDREGRLIEFNPAAERMFGHARADVIGRELAELIIPPSFRDAHRRGLARYLATGEHSLLGGRVEVSAQRADGTEFPVELTVTVVKMEGPPTFNAYIRDLTEQKRADAARGSLEMQLQQAQKMEAVGRLAGGVAHDFNNLLTVISGRAHMLLSRLKPGEPMHRDVDLIQKTSQRAVALTSQLLAFSRKQVVQPRVLELGPLVADLLPMLQRMIGENMELTVEPVEGTGRVKADPSQMQQVLMNLAVNARDAMPDGGRIRVSIRDVLVDEAAALHQSNLPPGPYVALAVSDTGTGMSAETAAHIFEPFFTTKEQGKGTGLGLSTVYGIIEQSRGHIEVQSVLGRGTTFTIHLPRVEEAPAAPPPDAGRRLRTTSRTVLVVDDEPEVLELAAEILKRVGYSVLEAPDGAAALEVARRHEGEIHLLVTDMVMPGMSGRDLTERLRAIRNALPVLYISGYVQDGAARTALGSEHSAFVAKPFTPEVFTDRVRELLSTAEAGAG
ncbi:MAG TPA: CHASE domain-containing protein [Methylomirabilota bacterium]|jgi:PAS domain S-box-containing protein|nr:CHASE domain-containing protein [Methylomirabilota bacterium]